jgi:phosphocarrier protein FPr
VLAQEMLHSKPVRIELAAGLDERTFGTDAVQILEAIRAAEDGAGVVVLMDLGSAVLSAELALELLDDEAARDRVLLCPAPMVEGLVVAAVAAAGGATRDEVGAEAMAALEGKRSQLGISENQPPQESGQRGAAETGSQRGSGPFVAAGPGTSLEGTFVVSNAHGLHARPAAKLVQEVRPLDAVVMLRNVSTGAGPVPASSLSRVATLGALRGHEIQVSATGPQAREALDHVLALAARAFDEDADSPGTPARGGDMAAARRKPEADDSDKTEADHSEGTTPPEGPDGGTTLTSARPAAPGIGIGPVWKAGPLAALVVPEATTEDPAADWLRVGRAIDDVRREIQHSQALAIRDVGEGDAAIFDAHLLLLDDGDVLDDVHARIDSGQAAAPAWAAAIARVEGDFSALSDPYLRARAGDVRAVGDQVMRVLLDIPDVTATASGVFVASDLTPAQVAGFDAERVKAVILAHGSPTSHGAILARAKGIPVVVGAGTSVLDIPDGTLVAVDGASGEVAVAPGDELLERFLARGRDLALARTAALARSSAPALTKDGTHVVVGANLGSQDDATLAARSGADLAGLVRTEFLFLGRSQAPDVDEQESAYLALAETLGGRRLTLRTLDVGGDKPLDYLPMPLEANPFLGLRGLRLSLAHPGLLADQLLACVRTAHATPVSLMFPMVSTVAELAEARRLLADAVALEGRGTPPGLLVGIMVEVPATALKTAAFARHVDFFSIGTNDLTQYTLAAERGNDAVAAVGDPYDPGVLRLIQTVCQGAGTALVAVCGELAADTLATPLLVGLGVRELSMTPAAIPQVKEVIRITDLREAHRLAAKAVTAVGPDAVKSLLTVHP